MRPVFRTVILVACAVFPPAGATVSRAAEHAAAPAAPVSPIRLTVTSTLDAPRAAETVELRADALAARVKREELSRLQVWDAGTGRELLAQAVDEDGDGTPDLLVFQADFPARGSREFTLVVGEAHKPRLEDFRVYGRFVRERQDDFAWENDRVAFRVYGPALETFVKEPLTSSAVDVWSKRTHRLVINDWYLVDDYHRDHGEGGDFYPAGRSRGCGGSGLIVDGGLAVSRNFRESRVFASGPIRLVFELVYPLWEKGVKAYERKRVTLDAASHFNRFDSVFTLEGSDELRWAAGIRKADGAQTRGDRQRGILRTWEYQGQYGDGGWLGCAVVVYPAQVAEISEANGNQLLTGRAKPGQPVTWYAGTGWDRGGEFADVEAWDRHVEAFAQRLAAPLRIEIR